MPTHLSLLSEVHLNALKTSSSRWRFIHVFLSLSISIQQKCNITFCEIDVPLEIKSIVKTILSGIRNLRFWDKLYISIFHVTYNLMKCGFTIRHNIFEPYICENFHFFWDSKYCISQRNIRMSFLNSFITYVWAYLKNLSLLSPSMISRWFQ